MLKVRQRFDSKHLDDVSAVLVHELHRFEPLIRRRMRVAIAVGSRGLDNLVAVVAGVCRFVKACGAEPFVVPAMGSHGGATAAGQRELLRLYGVTDEAIGAPVRATMDVVELPAGSLRHRIFMDRHAYESDGVILINRIKPHTDYHGKYESGLMKMTLIGLGKLEGALAVHNFGVRGLREMIGPGARQVLASGKILGGIGLVENAYHQTMVLKGLKAEEIPNQEPVLLDIAKANMPSLPTDAIDVLIIDRMGKDISGIGIDPNITGRIGVRGQDDPPSPRVKAMVVLDLTPQSHGNAIGVGLADVISRRLFDKINRQETDANVSTSSFLERGKIPMVAETDRGAFEMALRSCGHIAAGQERIVRILDTLHLEELYVSQAIADDLRSSTDVEVIGPAGTMFDANGSCVEF